MNTLETTATVDEDLGHLTLKVPLTTRPLGEVKVILMFDEPPPPPPKEKVDWFAAIGSYYRENPDAPRMTTAEWMEEMRGGEYED